MTTASIIEIFSSSQGEGPYAGERHLFVRFQGCSLSCQFCDTPASFVENPRCRVETRPFTKNFSYHDNPLSVLRLNGLLAFFGRARTLAVTGGEPLESIRFLKEWLPSLQGHYRVLLETAGIHHQELAAILPWVDVVSMDLKLPSVTGMRSYWEEHGQFAMTAMEKDLYIKVVVSAETSDQDLEAALEMVAGVNVGIPFILQPANPFAQFRSTPSVEQLSGWRERAQQRLDQVSIVPQLHKILKVL